MTCRGPIIGITNVFILVFGAYIGHAQAQQWQQQMCTADEFEYKYTDCDGAGKHWRVAVPKSGTSIDCQMPAPVLGPNCESACSPGEFLDVDGDQDCKKCPAGTFSTGGGVRFDKWDKIPLEFSIEQRRPLPGSIGNCSDNSNSWVAQGVYLEANPLSCGSILSLDMELVRDGKLTMEYTNTYPGIIAYIDVQNKCSAGNGISLLTKTTSKEPRTVTMDMSKGTNTITIALMRVTQTSDSGMSMFAIHNIGVEGTAYNAVCTPCKPGFSSRAGASHCSICDEDTYTVEHGSTECKPCNRETEFAPPGATACLQRPPCTENDYYKSLAPCDNRKKTYAHYAWIQPRFCNENLLDSKRLPPNGEEQNCPDCNPGQALTDSGVCEFCPNGHFSDGRKPCAPCPLHTEARKSISYKWFHTLPDRLTTGCIQTGGDSGGSFCDKQRTWSPQSDHMTISNDISDSEFAVLTLNVSGLSNSTIDGRVYGELEIEYETSCDPKNPCIFFVMLASGKNDIHPIYQTNASQPRYTFSYKFMDPVVDTISLAFRKTTFPTSGSQNTINVYRISLTNTLHGGAPHCEECMLHGSEKGCQGCGEEQIIVINNATNKRHCSKCPANSYVKDSFHCEPCGAGLVANGDSSGCHSTCTLDATGKHFDFSRLAGLHRLDGIQMFTADGTSYFSTFNFTLCRSLTTDRVKCEHNVSSEYFWDDQLVVESLVCRSTILPSASIMSVQPMSLGDYLVNVTVNDALEQTRLHDGGIQFEDEAIMVHYNYATDDRSVNCLQGRSTTITLACDPLEKGNGTISLPTSCPTGTCDGCHYMLFWSTSYACPVCRQEDYQVVLGQCINGEQDIIYIPPKYCVKSDETMNKPATQPCSLLTLPIKIIIGCAGLVALLLLGCVIYCWKRSKKLEYKYMKLVAGSGQGGEIGELPAAETCAISSDDEDDHVAFRVKGDQLFTKLSSNGKSDGFEKMKLVGSSLSEL